MKKKTMKEMIFLKVTKRASFCYHFEDDLGYDVFDLFQKDLLHEVKRFVLQTTNLDGLNALRSDWVLTYLG